MPISSFTVITRDINRRFGVPIALAITHGMTMSFSSPIERMRAAIACQLEQFGVQDTAEMHETLLIRNGLFCGRKFQCSGHMVVWFIEEDEVKFFSPCGDMLKATSAVECLARYAGQEQVHRRAA